jgi:hypothetical protein
MEKSIMATAKKQRDTLKSKKVLSYMTYHPNATTETITSKFNISKQYVYVLRHKIRKMAKTLTPQTAITPIVKPAIVEKHFGIDIDKAHDPVNEPSHYKVGGIETIDFIEAKGLNYNLGNAIKYITRADHKGSKAQDLAKAIWYLRREITHNVPNNT